MKEDQDMVEGGFQFVGQHAKFDVFTHHGEHILLHHDKPFSRQPYDMVDEVSGPRVAYRVESLCSPRAKKLFGQNY